MSDGLERIVSTTGSALDVVSLAEAKNKSRVTVDTADDELITLQIMSALRMCETYLSRDILPRTREQFVLTNSRGDISLYYPPIAAVTEVEIEGVVVPPAEYELIGLSDDPRIRLNDTDNNYYFNDLYENDDARKVKITYTTAGLVSDGNVKLAMLSIVDDLYANRQPYMFRTILSPLRIAFI